MKNLIMLCFLSLTLFACDNSTTINPPANGGGNGGAQGGSQGGSGNGPTDVSSIPQRPNGNTISLDTPADPRLFSKIWTIDQSFARLEMIISQNQIKLISNCRNGLSASIAVRVEINATQISILENKISRIDQAGDHCEVSAEKSITDYRIQNGLLNANGVIFN